MGAKSIRPMEPIMGEKLIQKDTWLYQVKWDGVRILSYIGQENTRLTTRKGTDRTATYPELVEALQEGGLSSAILDGEVIALEKGRPSFYRLLKRDLSKDKKRRSALQQEIPVYYMVFDLLNLDGQWLTDQPLEERLARLQEICPSSNCIHFCESHDDGEKLFSVTRDHDLEGIIMKERKGKYYLGKKHPTWQKLKHFRKLDAQVIGVTMRAGRVNALLLGKKRDQDWVYIGGAASGLSAEELRLLTEWLPQLEQKEPIVINPPPITNGCWVTPVLTVEVKYLEWTPDGTLRTPSIIRFKQKT